MAAEVFWDTSGFFALLNADDAAHEKARRWTASTRNRSRRAVTTEWVIGECCTLLLARRKTHLVPMFLDFTEQSGALLIVNPDDLLIAQAKAFMRKHLDQGFSLTDCLSFCVMREHRIAEAFT